MSKCIKCGRELNTGGTLEIYSGMCGKCYEEQYDKFVKKIYGKYLFGVTEKPLRQQIDQLKQQLAEKDKEIERLKERLSVFDDFKDNYGYTNYDDSEILEDLQSRAFQAEDDTRVVNELLQFFNIFDENELVDKVKEPQTQLAIQELEKVKNFVDGRTYCADYIKKRIKELKGEKDVED